MVAEPMVLLVIDTVSAALCGGDENSPRDMGAFVNRLRHIQAQLPNAHIIAVHHQPHEAARLRGHGALLGAVDTTLEVNGSNPLCRTATVRKQNDGVEGEGVAFALESVLLHEDQFGPTTAPVVVSAAAEGRPTSRNTSRLSNSRKIALSALHEAIVEVGEIPPASNHIPAGIRAVPMSGWRRQAYQRGISGSSEERARQQAFKRASEALLAVGLIGTWDGLVWLL
jgi:hypothetical protein